MVKKMAVLKPQQRSAQKKCLVTPRGKTPPAATKILQMLGFGMGEKYYGIDLREARDVIRDLMMIQSCATGSMTERFIRHNRRDTIVFDLGHCLKILGEGECKRKTTSFFMLDEKIADCGAGILVPGIPSFLTGEYPKKPAGTNSRTCSVTPLQGIFRNSGPGSWRTFRGTCSLLNLRECVENCIVHLKYQDSTTA